MKEQDIERMTELLADKATQGLTAEELAELKRLEEQYGEMESFELTAAAISLASINTQEEMMPANLRARVLEDAQKFFEKSSVTTSPKQNGEQPAARVVPFPERRRRRSNNFIQWSGWLAAACVLLGFILWASRPAEQPVKPRELTNTEKREQLLTQAKDLVKSSWQATKLPQAENVAGDVIWSKSEQKGYMRFRNLPVNDKTKETYQLWIFDKNQDEKYPVDGGVFDVNENGEVVVPITAKLNVAEPTLFAVTIEKPGGVVVSKRDRLILTAAVQ